MSASTTQSFLSDFLYKIINSSADSLIHKAGLILDFLVNKIWESHWKFILIFLLIVIITKIFTGNIGSLLYNFFYFSILALIIAIWGWDVLFNTYFALLYPISYFFTGLVLRKIH